MLKPGLLRFALALLVILFHITKFVFLGHFAVLCFFMLSGYWISYIYNIKYKESATSLLPFYISRIWRLLPVYLLLNFLAILLANHYYNNLHEYTAYLSRFGEVLFWLSNTLILGFGFFPKQVLSPAWSLDIELQFYLLFPLLFNVLLKSRPYLLKLFWLFVALLIPISFLPAESLINKTAIIYLPYFLIGSIIYLKDITFDKKTEAIFTGFFLLTLFVNYLTPYLREQTIYHHLSDYNRHLNDYLPLLLIPLISNSVRNKARSPIDSTLGEMSYVMYLTHWAVIIPYNYYMQGQPLATKLIYSIIYLLTTIILSYLFYAFYDKPIDRIRRKWTLNNPPLQVD